MTWPNPDRARSHSAAMMLNAISRPPPAKSPRIAGGIVGDPPRGPED